ncbi:MAG TPA: hypothetical protein PLV92_05365, partial [Pirellulaceae bacterium]|nr:hypothetical protein [Pirellulaceae bacterium]
MRIRLSSGGGDGGGWADLDGVASGEGVVHGGGQGECAPPGVSAAGRRAAGERGGDEVLEDGEQRGVGVVRAAG